MMEFGANRSETFVPTPAVLGIGLGLGLLALFLWGVYQVVIAREDG